MTNARAATKALVSETLNALDRMRAIADARDATLRALEARTNGKGRAS